jgi:hypothetical protein
MKYELTNGTQDAINPRVSPKNDAPAVSFPKTVGDVMDILATTTHSYKMLSQTNILLANHFDMPPEQILLDTLADEKNIHAFCLRLETGKYKPNAVNTYRKHVQFLVNTAKRHGWKPGKAVSQEWRKVLDASMQRGCSTLAKSMSGIRAKPEDVTIADVEEWAKQRGRDGFSFGSATQRRTKFWRLLHELGCTSQRPMCLIRDKNYGVKLEDFPESLKQEVLSLLAWKTREYAPGRSRKARHRLVTAKTLQAMICRLYGYATLIKTNEIGG